MVGELYCRLSIESSLLVVGLDKYVSYISIWIRWEKEGVEYGIYADMMSAVTRDIIVRTALHCTALRCTALLHRKEHEARSTGHGARGTGCDTRSRGLQVSFSLSTTCYPFTIGVSLNHFFISRALYDRQGLRTRFFQGEFCLT